MKVSVLVAAAMVITSVNASGKGRPKGLFKKGGGMKGSDSSWTLVEKDPEPGSSQDSPRRGMGQRLLQISLVRKLRSGSSRNSPKHQPRPGPLQDPPVYKPGQRIRFMPRKKDPVCDPIVKELYISQHKFSDLNHRFWLKEPEFHKLLKKKKKKMDDEDEDNVEFGIGNDGEEEEEEDDEEEKIKAEALRVEAIQKWIELHHVAIPRLREIKEEYSSLKESHLIIWGKLLDNDCPTKEFKRLSPEGMERRGYFPEWDFEFDLIDLRRK
ncbi:hypothetical protein BASA50_004555 [Batrachochytrium salamandrivorans]|uniref:Uncharacterized protein n=1 Tax=Batrachochytrium salamandrivorans TaxID=1357716 RepID=A0ABQ8FF05_9FUNG|nr:hypothetical protein BASA62_006730 [Batrachochytrium salamandrivorans]KAH6579867.1 hypothetical protein BASA60_003103 [Batrachochytrium salamandrivorans]KAH6597081.1 hypothetical protein BASA61_003264 [Batrachochytrium salamandrivorans]KAH6597203.1 hypothetical protein BASA50_004555 [Batrachochytrium salamandrivorans]KAH9277031.1 hypothetical protein BASA83_000549 [Batrachochytrium salamandrivorans]